MRAMLPFIPRGFATLRSFSYKVPNRKANEKKHDENAFHRHERPNRPQPNENYYKPMKYCFSSAVFAKVWTTLFIKHVLPRLFKPEKNIP